MFKNTAKHPVRKLQTHLPTSFAKQFTHHRQTTASLIAKLFAISEKLSEYAGSQAAATAHS